jgi:hypothetical protein
VCVLRSSLRHRQMLLPYAAHPMQPRTSVEYFSLR